MTTNTATTQDGASDFDARVDGQRLMKAWYAGLDDANARGAHVANVFVMGNAVEILRAFDFELVFPEINSLQTGVRKASEEYIRLSEDYGMSPDVCSYVKADVGLILKEQKHPAGQIPKADIAIASNMCSTFIKWAEIWERMLGTPAFVLDLPGQRSAGFEVRQGDAQHAADSRWVEAQFRDLIEKCEKLTGKRLDLDKLAEILDRVNKMVAHWNAVMELNRACPAPFNAMLDGLTYIGIMNVYRGTDEGVEYMKNLEASLRARVARGEGRVENERFRLLFSGTPCYVSMRRLVELFESWGGVFVYSDYLTFAAGGMDAGELVYDTSRPLESLAEITTLAAQRGLSNQFFAHERLAKQIREYAVDGIVFHGIKSCRFVSSGMADTRDYLGSRLDAPSLYIESDLIDPRYWSDAQIKNRVDAFFETLERRVGGAPMENQPAAQRRRSLL
ncbi:MAG: 2-hydroxyacyl-CoA dehydratase family protein [Sorangiineae bacterium]|nr:2-hydroxyacyl-CoA dehydratase family protein [Polyangiaceae bacterium]MEB2322080.1 2-hydroxyacyl-CoA dehydratase family protein [Sorangiineae bacterium]